MGLNGLSDLLCFCEMNLQLRVTGHITIGSVSIALLHIQMPSLNLMKLFLNVHGTIRTAQMYIVLFHATLFQKKHFENTSNQTNKLILQEQNKSLNNPKKQSI